ncbi:MAG: ATP-binding protein [Bergeyella sp.]
MQNRFELYCSQFRAVALMGSRQTGKTTLARTTFPKKPYINFENLDNQILAREDTKNFLESYKETGAIFDEVQNVPEVFNYLQQILDEESEAGKYILTGSSNFLLNEKISQSLAGRVGFLHLYPFSAKEITDFSGSDISIEELIFKGGYPEIWDKKINPSFYHNSYVQSFIEKDIRQLININNLLTFQQFVKLTATRASQELNHSNIASDLGIDYKTVQSWLGLLQNVGIIFLIPPYYNNYGKRVVKRPKLYFNDTGLLCNLLGISDETQLETHPLKGEIFENFVFAEILKYNDMKTIPAKIFYWRTISGVEIDLILEENFTNTGIEIKSGKTYHQMWWKNILKWREYSPQNKSGNVIYAGNDEVNFKDDRKLISAKNLFEKFS